MTWVIADYNLRFLTWKLISSWLLLSLCWSMEWARQALSHSHQLCSQMPLQLRRLASQPLVLQLQLVLLLQAHHRLEPLLTILGTSIGLIKQGLTVLVLW